MDAARGDAVTAAAAEGNGGAVVVDSEDVENDRTRVALRAYERSAEYFCSGRSISRSSLPRYCASIVSKVEILPGLCTP